MVERDRAGIWSPIQEFAWSAWGKQRITSVRIASFWTKIWTQNLSSLMQNATKSFPRLHRSISFLSVRISRHVVIKGQRISTWVRNLLTANPQKAATSVRLSNSLMIQGWVPERGGGEGADRTLPPRTILPGKLRVQLVNDNMQNCSFRFRWELISLFLHVLRAWECKVR
jgi:hypothetical protein